MGYINEHQLLYSLMTSAETEFYAAAEKLENFCKPFYTTEYAYLYDVEIPDDTGNNYLGWEKGVSSEDIRAAMMVLEGNGYDVPNDFGANVYDGEDLLNAIERVVFEDEAFEAALIAGVRIYPGKYGPIASQILSEMGYVGISVPTNYTNGHRNEDVRNYVIFNESDAKIVGTTRFQNDNGDTLGFVDKDGTCYIDADNAQMTTPIHEIGIHMLMDVAKQEGDINLHKAIIEYGKKAPQRFKDHVSDNYDLEAGSDEYYEEVAAHAFAAAYENRQAKFAQRSEFRDFLQKIWDFIKRAFGGRYANTDVFKAVEKMGEDKIGKKLYNIVMGGREIKRINDAMSSAEDGIVRQQIMGEKGALNIAVALGDNAIVENLEAAKKMRSDGADMLDIKKATGWEYDDRDGKWRTEGSDALSSNVVEEAVRSIDEEAIKALMSDESARGDLGDVTLADLLADGEAKDRLLAAYPELATAKIRLYAQDNGESGGMAHDGRSGELNITRNDGKLRPAAMSEMRETLIHEIQHRIQRIEGFAIGGNPEMFLSDVGKEAKEKYLEAEAQYEVSNSISDLVKAEEYRRLYKNEYAKAVEEYRKLLGEREAVNSSYRANMTDEERRNSLIRSTEGAANGGEMSDEDVIVLFDDKNKELDEAVDDKSLSSVLAREEAMKYIRAIEADDMTSAGWLSYLKAVGLDDQDLMYFLGESGYRDADDVITKDEIFDYLEHRAENDDAYNRAIEAALEDANKRFGWVRGKADDIWRYLKDDIISYNRLLSQLADFGIMVDEDDNLEFRHNTQAASAAYEISQQRKAIIDPMRRALADLAIKLGSLGYDEGETYAKVSDYLMALHAPERNKELTCRKVVDEINEWAKKNAGGFTVTVADVEPFYSGAVTAGIPANVEAKINSIFRSKYNTEESRVMAGMTDSEAADVVSDFEALLVKADALDEISNLVEKINDANRYSLDFALKNGLISKDEYDTYTTVYEHSSRRLGR